MKKALLLAAVIAFAVASAAWAGKEKTLIAAKAKAASMLTETKATEILKKEAAARGDKERDIRVLWVHNGEDDAIVRVKDTGRMILVRMARAGENWRVDAVEARTGVWLRTTR